MKIQLVKEERSDGIIYSVEVNGRYLAGSCSTTEDEAEEVFRKVVAHKGKFPAKITLITTTIPDDEQVENKAD